MTAIVRIIALVLPLSLFTSVAVAQPSLKDMDAELRQYDKVGQFSGAVLVAKGDKVLYRGAIGNAVEEWNIPNDVDTRFRIGSLTKQFTAALILQLAEEERIDLQAPITSYLPDYPREQGDRVTVYQLLTQTSGIVNYTSLPEFQKNIKRRHLAVDSLPSVFSKEKLEFTPGSAFAYSNSNYFLLGLIIEKVTKQRYDYALRERILRPLGLDNTGYDHNDQVIPRLAQGYYIGAGVRSRADFIDSNIPYAAGMLYSTVGDLWKWTRALHAGKVFRKSATLELMLKPAKGTYACGLMVTSLMAGKDSVRAVLHSGGIDGFSAQLWYLPDGEYTIVALDNTTGDAGALAKAAFALLHGIKAPKPRIPISQVIFDIIAEKGVDAGIARYRTLKKEHPDEYDFSESELNALGYSFISNARYDIARSLFALNLEMYPDAWNTWDSMGEVLALLDEKDEAIRHYRKALELNPGSISAREALRTLGAEVKDELPAPTAEVLEQYVGQYELVPGFILTVTREGTRLFLQATGQERFEVYPMSETSFFLKVVDARITFQRDEAGAVNGLILRQNGRDMPATRKP